MKTDANDISRALGPDGLRRVIDNTPAEKIRAHGPAAAPRAEEPPKPRFRTLEDFCAEYTPFSEILGGVLCSGSLYTMTARTGVGKTAWLVSTALAIVTGRADILGRPVKQGRVALCTAENPDGLRMRLAVGSFRWNVDQAAVNRDMLVSDNRVRPEEICAYLEREAQDHGPFAAVFIDTWQAFFDGKDANNPTDAVNFTRRFRPLTRLPGAPAVVIAAHPVKDAANDNLLPYGGGSTLNEVDGNLTLAPQPGGLIELSWQGKLRGLDFEPPLYRIENLCSPAILDTGGHQVALPVMLSTSQDDAEARENAIANRDVRLLRALAENPQGSLSTVAMAANLERSKARRALERMTKAKPPLIRKALGKHLLTKDGKEALKSETTISTAKRHDE